MKLKKYHGLPAATLGLIMREAVKRGMEEVRKKLKNFEVHEKIVEYKAEDQVTDADYAAQQAMKRVLEENFPMAGIIAEESGLKKECSHKKQLLTFTIDPLDGTKAFVRKQSDGIGCMLALVETTEKNGTSTEDVISVCIGDIMTNESYYYRPESDSTHRLHSDRRELLKYVAKKHRRLLMLDDIRIFPEVYQHLSFPESGYYQSISVVNGSIGTNFARLWKGEVDAMILKEQRVTPWDLTPVYGISKKLGFEFITIEPETKIYHLLKWLQIAPLQIKIMPTTLVIHETQIQSLIDWLNENKYHVLKG